MYNKARNSWPYGCHICIHIVLSAVISFYCMTQDYQIKPVEKSV